MTIGSAEEQGQNKQPASPALPSERDPYDRQEGGQTDAPRKPDRQSFTRALKTEIGNSVCRACRKLTVVRIEAGTGLAGASLGVWTPRRAS